MSCNSCMIGGADIKIIDALKPYSIIEVRKMFKHFGKEYDNENERTANLAILSRNIRSPLRRVNEWIKKNNPKKIKKMVTKLSKKNIKFIKKRIRVDKLKKRVKGYKKKKQCNTRLSSKKKVLKSVADNQKIKLKGKKITVKKLREAIKLHKKIHCPGISKMRKSELEAFVAKHKIPLDIQFTKKPEIKTFIITSAEKKDKKKAADEISLQKKKYHDMDDEELNIPGWENIEPETLKEAHEKAIKLRKSIKSKKPKRKRKKVSFN